MNKKNLFGTLALFTTLAIFQVANAQPLPVVKSKNTQSNNNFNPDMSVNFLGLIQKGTSYSNDRTQAPFNGIQLQEAEVQFSSDVDAYFKANALLAIANEGGSWGLDPEEIFLETTSLKGITIKAGKFKLALGKHNQLHTHAFPFIDAPLTHTTLTGEEGVNEAGVSLAYLIPAPWYSEFFVQAFDPSSDVMFNSTDSSQPGLLVKSKNLFDLNDSSTIEFGLTGIQGNNQFDLKTRLFGLDLTYKWRPTLGGKYQALVLGLEYLNGQHQGLNDSTAGLSMENLSGLVTYAQYQFAERWWIQGRHESFGLSHSEAYAPINKESVLLGFIPSEFSGMRLQYDFIKTKDVDQADHTIAFQYNISIGAHPAHMY